MPFQTLLSILKQTSSENIRDKPVTFSEKLFVAKEKLCVARENLAIKFKEVIKLISLIEPYRQVCT